jgi:hypothetical protein
MIRLSGRTQHRALNSKRHGLPQVVRLFQAALVSLQMQNQYHKNMISALKLHDEQGCSVMQRTGAKIRVFTGRDHYGLLLTTGKLGDFCFFGRL